MAVAGLGSGLAMATSMSAALVELDEEKSGVGSAVLQAVNKTGGPLGIAVLGSVLSAGYLALSTLPASPRWLPPSERASSVAWRSPTAPLGARWIVRTAFVHGMDMALLVSAGIALVGMVLTISSDPSRTEPDPLGWVPRAATQPVPTRVPSVTGAVFRTTGLLLTTTPEATGPLWVGEWPVARRANVGGHGRPATPPTVDLAVPKWPPACEPGVAAAPPPTKRSPRRRPPPAGPDRRVPRQGTRALPPHQISP